MRSGASFVRPVEPFTFFIDRSLGSGLVPEALRRENERVVVHDDHFRQQDVADVVWLGEAGAGSDSRNRAP
jgi:hypothetical protein